MARRLAAPALLCLLLPIIGCSAPSRQTVMILEAPGPAERLAVDVENFRGDVIVIAEPRRTDIAIETTVVASRDIPKPDLDNALGSVAVDGTIETDPTQQTGFNTLRVRSTSLRPGASDVHAEVTVRVPRCDGARVINAGGFVELVDVSGGLHVDNVDGAILVRTSRPLVEPITLLTSNATIYCQVPEGTTGVIDLHSLDGTLAFKDKFGTSHDIRYTPQHLQARLGDGTNPIIMRTNIGQVRFLVMEEPMAFTRAVKRPPPDIYSKLYLQGSRRYTLNLPDDSSADVSETDSGVAP